MLRKARAPSAGFLAFRPWVAWGRDAAFSCAARARPLSLAKEPPAPRLVRNAYPMPDLKLIALDADDLAIVSAHLQDAVIKLGDMAYQKSDKRFVMVANRFDWAQAQTGSAAPAKQKNFARRRSGVRFERVIGAKVQGLDPKKKEQFISLLAVTFEPGAEPGGIVQLHFSGGAAVRLEVECVEAEMQDLGGAWTTRRKPQHQEPDAG